MDSRDIYIKLTDPTGKHNVEDELGAIAGATGLSIINGKK